jgi:uncharacterized protein YbbK (DUF523 family)
MTDAREPDSSAAWRSPDLEIKIGISSCLLGEAVRYDGGHQKDSYITGALSRHFTFVSVCPEMELGLGAPRETLRLVGDATAPRLVATQSGTDLTQAMDTYARARVGALGGLSGYMLKRASPSCGMERVKVYPDAGMLSRSGTGLFARRLMDAYPRLPVASSATSDVDSCRWWCPSRSSISTWRGSAWPMSPTRSTSRPTPRSSCFGASKCPASWTLPILIARPAGSLTRAVADGINLAWEPKLS